MMRPWWMLPRRSWRDRLRREGGYFRACCCGGEPCPDLEITFSGVDATLCTSCYLSGWKYLTLTVDGTYSMSPSTGGGGSICSYELNNYNIGTHLTTRQFSGSGCTGTETNRSQSRINLFVDIHMPSQRLRRIVFTTNDNVTHPLNYAAYFFAFYGDASSAPEMGDAVTNQLTTCFTLPANASDGPLVEEYVITTGGTATLAVVP